ncbi:MAG: hypothetical protein COT25_01800 [Candidatus Kerfeldbacteria bacterium CG08_land_8_20_14_0_20_42_7]|uniref:Uncharacterized protein n=1 Tax=Candidatus Kerfeldbacteria bacterium CG08_land_8_20_14_0_20_42_7 TaxID=2014245 RepID=A0A2H0YTB8_9BACT|nr:MAG: hypothetical protein COT25_01800 [Candidatus Kerfeldbacteria bacterium CG08_land_8_20_14_0_20_42_7]
MFITHPRIKALLILATFVLLFTIFIHPVHAVSDNLLCEDPQGNVIPDRSKLIKVAIPIPGFVHEIICYDTQNSGQKIEKERYYYVVSLSDYLANLYQYFVGIVGILAAVMIMYGGIMWILAAGNQSRIQSAKNVIFSAIIGVVIAFSSYLLLYLLNPRTVDYETLQATLDVQAIQKVGDYSEFCKDFENPGTLNPLTYQYYFHIIDKGTEAIGVDRPTTSYIGSEYYCGDKVAKLEVGKNYVVGDKTGICYGDKCATQGQVCVNTGPSSYECQSTFLRGKINWPSSTMMYVDYITLVPVCINGEVPGGGLQQGGDLKNNITEEAHSYTFPFNGGGSIGDYATNLRSKMQDCVRVVLNKNEPEPGKTDLDYFAGFYMDVEVNDDTSWGWTTDDSYAVGTECIPVQGVDWSKKSPSDLTKDEWMQIIVNEQLIPWSAFFEDPTDPQASDVCKRDLNYCLLRTKTCNLEINRQQYPSR